MGGEHVNKGKIVKLLLVIIALTAVLFVLLTFWLVEDDKSILPDSGQTNSLNIDIREHPNVQIIDETVPEPSADSANDVILPEVAPAIAPETIPNAPVIFTDSDLLATSGRAEPSSYDSLLHNLGFDLHEKDVAADTSSKNSVNYCKKLVYEAMTSLPQYHVNAIDDLTLSLNTDGKRGLAGNGLLLLRCAGVEDDELVAVLLHEMGHIVDGSYLTGTVVSGKSAFLDLGKPVFNNDKSTEYYNLSWKTNNSFVDGYSENDFCSSYGMTDPYEDFAECYIYYILHGEEFRIMANENSVLKQKYDFMKEDVFSGITYEFDGETAAERTSVPYDVVQLPYNYTAFLNQ
ncbi:MAG: hypothetical protein WC269_01510 [Candidatus Gracilibacteria bacterium]|jgi:hypothetical protein